MGRQKGREILFRDPYEVTQVVGAKCARLDPAARGPHRDGAALRDVLDREKVV